MVMASHNTQSTDQPPSALNLGVLVALVAFALAGWALVTATEAMTRGDEPKTALWIAVAHAAVATAAFFGRDARWVRLVYIAAAIVLGILLGFTVIEAGWNDLDKTSMSLLVFTIALPPALRSTATGGLAAPQAQLVRETLRQRSTVPRIVAGVTLFGGLLAWMAFELPGVAAILTATSAALAFSGLWTAGIAYAARSELM
jgi:hypothetical protein